MNTKTFADLFAQQIEKEEQQEGSVIQGTIVGFGRNGDVLVDVCLKSEGLIPRKEFEVGGEMPELKIGDRVDVYLDRIEGRNGNTVLSRDKARRDERWIVVEEIMNKAENIEGVIIGRVKGGFAVDLDGVIAFLPGSQVDIRPIRDVSALIGEKQPFKILKMDNDQGNIVVSRRAILEESRQEAKDELLSQIKEGTVLKGEVKNITDYGAFIDLGAIDGLLHITDIAWQRITHPSELLKIGETVEVVVTKYNEDTKRVSLGLKQLTPNPWEELVKRLKPGTILKDMEVTTVTEYGAFVELEPGVEGLIHCSEVSWNSKNVQPRNFLKVGDKVDVMILDIDVEKHRISLSIKQCQENPWEKIIELNPIGSTVEGTVKNIVDFGIFLELPVGDESGETVEALIPTVELSWDSNPEKEIANYKKGDKVQAMVMSSSSERERVTLSVKQLTKDSLSEVAEKYAKGSVATCTVKSVKNDGIEVELEEGVTSFIRRSDLSKHKEEQRSDKFSEGDRIDVKVVNFDKNNRKFTLSIKALEIEQEKKAIEQYGSADSGASLGDILGDVLTAQKRDNK
jgi:small subunit ribosomal protein S1